MNATSALRLRFKFIPPLRDAEADDGEEQDGEDEFSAWCHWFRSQRSLIRNQSQACACAVQDLAEWNVRGVCKMQASLERRSCELSASRSVRLSLAFYRYTAAGSILPLEYWTFDVAWAYLTRIAS